MFPIGFIFPSGFMGTVFLHVSSYLSENIREATIVPPNISEPTELFVWRRCLGLSRTKPRFDTSWCGVELASPRLRRGLTEAARKGDAEAACG
jgi:hypothetical protein